MTLLIKLIAGNCYYYNEETIHNKKGGFILRVKF